MIVKLKSGPGISAEKFSNGQYFDGTRWYDPEEIEYVMHDTNQASTVDWAQLSNTNQQQHRMLGGAQALAQQRLGMQAAMGQHRNNLLALSNVHSYGNSFVTDLKLGKKAEDKEMVRPYPLGKYVIDLADISSYGAYDTGIWILYKNNTDSRNIGVNNPQEELKKLNNAMFKPKETSKMKEILTDIKGYISEHKSTLYTVMLVLLVDHFFLDGKLRSKVQAFLDKALSKAEEKLDGRKD